MGNATDQTSDPPSAPASGPAPTAALGHGLAIEYTAFARSFRLLASCSYPMSGFTIFFHENGGKCQLMDQPPAGVFANLVTRYAACGPTQGVSLEADELSRQAPIADALAAHLVEVHPWR